MHFFYLSKRFVISKNSKNSTYFVTVYLSFNFSVFRSHTLKKTLEMFQQVYIKNIIVQTFFRETSYVRTHLYSCSTSFTSCQGFLTFKYIFNGKEEIAKGTLISQVK